MTRDKGTEPHPQLCHSPSGSADSQMTMKREVWRVSGRCVCWGGGGRLRGGG